MLDGVVTELMEGVRMLDGVVTDSLEAKALSFNIDHIDVFSASWGPTDDGTSLERPGRLASAAFEKGIREVQYITSARYLFSLFVLADRFIGPIRTISPNYTCLSVCHSQGSRVMQFSKNKQ